MTHTPPTDQQLDEIAARAAWLYEYVHQSKDGDILAGTEVPALVAEVRRQRAEFESATEFRLMPQPPAYTPLILRRDPAYDGTGWAVLHDPGDSAVRRAWTAEGWEMAWASSHEEIYCWADAASALFQARRAMAKDDGENDGTVDGIGRTPESYQSTPHAPAAVAAVVETGE